MKIAIVGSRDFPNLDDVREYIRRLPEGTVIVSGGARGVDAVAEETAKECGFQTMIFPADWKTFHKSAGFRRNVDIVTAADKVVAFWNGRSNGTRHSISLAKEQGKQLEVYVR